MKTPKVYSWQQSEATQYIGRILGSDSYWDVYDCSHFSLRSIERTVGKERGKEMFCAFLEDVVFGANKEAISLIEKSSKNIIFDKHGEHRQRFQIRDMINHVSFIFELYPKTKEIFAITCLVPEQESSDVRRKVDNFVIECRPAQHVNDELVSEVQFLIWSNERHGFIRKYTGIADASCLNYSTEEE